MSQLKFTKEHEWVYLEGNVAVIGITEYAQNALGELVYIELPSVGDKIDKGDDFAVVESVKVASEVYSPVSGEVVDVNGALEEDAESLKGDIENSWIAKIKIEDKSELEDLMDEASYEEYTSELD